MTTSDKSLRSASIAAAVEKLEQLLIANLSPGKFGFVRVEVVIQNGAMVRLETSQTDSIKLTT